MTVSGTRRRRRFVVPAVLAALWLAARIVRVAARRRRVRRMRRRPLRHVGLVSVVVPARNEAATVGATVRSLVVGDYPDVEIIVVDDGSTDGTADLVEALGLPGVLVLRQPGGGRAAALRNGFAYARGDLLVVVDPGTMLAPDAVGRLVQPFADPGVGAVSGAVSGAAGDGRRQPDEDVPAVSAFRRAALPAAARVPAAAGDVDPTTAVIGPGWRVAAEPAGVVRTEVPAAVGGPRRRPWTGNTGNTGNSGNTGNAGNTGGSASIGRTDGTGAGAAAGRAGGGAAQADLDARTRWPVNQAPPERATPGR